VVLSVLCFGWGGIRRFHGGLTWGLSSLAILGIVLAGLGMNVRLELVGYSNVSIGLIFVKL
jgi:hypothetical protein